MLAAGRPELGPEVSEFAVRLIGPVDTLCEFPGKGYYPINPIPERLTRHVDYERRRGL